MSLESMFIHEFDVWRVTEATDSDTGEVVETLAVNSTGNRGYIYQKTAFMWQNDRGKMVGTKRMDCGTDVDIQENDEVRYDGHRYWVITADKKGFVPHIECVMRVK